MSGGARTTELRTSDGRVPGSRGRATRERLLQATSELLSNGSYLELSIAGIARQTGTSAATFYQYFPTLDDALLVLAEEMIVRAGSLTPIVREAPWERSEAMESCRQLVAAFFHFWEESRAVIRVVEVLAEEGDERFQRIRKRLLNDLTVALRDAMRTSKPADHPTASLDAMSGGAVLVSMLAHVATYRNELRYWHVKPDHATEHMAAIVYWLVTGRDDIESVRTAARSGVTLPGSA